MPTLPLDQPAYEDDDHGHNAPGGMPAPGGYACHSFFAEDLARGIRVVASVWRGDAFDPAYLRRYRRYRRRPTRVHPPLPREFPCVRLAVYEADQRLASVVTREAVSSVVQRLANGAWRLAIPGTADLTFDYDAATRPVNVAPPPLAPGHHFAAGPLCGVRGLVHAGPRRIAFDGRGSREWFGGTEPLAPLLRRWISGRLIVEREAVTFHVVQRKRPGGPRAGVLVVSDAGAVRAMEVACQVPLWHDLGLLRLAYPRALRLGGDEVTLDSPRVLESSLSRVRLLYHARRRGGSEATAICDVTHPHRLAWPIVGRLMAGR